MRFIIYGFWVAYYYTIGRIVMKIQYRIATRKSDRAWREFMENVRFGRRND